MPKVCKSHKVSPDERKLLEQKLEKVEQKITERLRSTEEKDRKIQESNNGGASGGGQVDRRGSRYTMPEVLTTKPKDLPTKRGTSGQVVPLQTNYFRLLKKPTWQLYQYRVDFSPLIENGLFKKKIIRELKGNFGGGYLFDGSILFLPVKLKNATTEYMTKDRDGNPIQILVKYTKLVPMNTAEGLQVLNLILRCSMSTLNLKLIGRNFFDAIARIDIPQFGLQLWPGYITSIRQHEVDILLCAEITNKVMRTETVLDILRECATNRYDRNYQQTSFNLIVGMTVLTTYNNKTYTISDIDYNRSPESTFTTKNGDVSFVNYYKQKYELVIRDRKQPLLVSKLSPRNLRSGKPDFILLLPELCRATGLTARMTSAFRLMSAIATYTRRSPKSRIKILTAFNRRLHGQAESMANLREWNFGLGQNLVELKGRCLDNERILFGNNRSTPTNMDADWSREFRNVSMYLSHPIKNWVVVVPQKTARETCAFLGVLQRAVNGMCYEIARPIVIEIPTDRIESYVNGLEEAVDQNPQLIMCIVPNASADRYSVIKKKCCVERGIPTQVILSKTITPKYGKDVGSLLTVGTKVAIQINCKLGGVPWMIDIPLTGLMVVGFDVSHGIRNKKEKSYGAMVATMDMKLSQKYFSTVSAHKDGEELSNNIDMMINKALVCYQHEHKCLPKKILFYRDGVGEGQTNYVYEHEIKNLRKKLDTLYNGPSYKLTFIVVSKRINTRFFQNRQNPNPGTVVDDVVTLPERYDFFLISQSVKHGTVSPTNYNILYDTLGISANKLQIITYKMTHLYYNWTGTLSVPAVCQYAHKLAFLVGNYINQTPNANLEKKLYFL